MLDSMTPSEMLSIYMDGELDEQSTSSLFYMMAQDPELQLEMQQLMTLRSATTSASLQVPAHLKNAVIMQTVGNNAGKTTSGFIPTLGLMVGAAAIASISTAWYFLSDSSNNTENVIKGNSSTQQMESRAIPDEPNKNTVQSFVAIKNNSTDGLESTTVLSTGTLLSNSRTITSASSSRKGDKVSDEPTIHDVYAQTLAQETNVVSNTESEISQTQVSINQSILLQPTFGVFNGGSRGMRPELAQLSDNVTNDNELQTVEISLRGIAPTSFQNTSFEAPTRSFGNWGATVFYIADENNALGVEAGYDKWVQVYDGKEGDTSVRYEQHFNALTMGLAYRHLFATQEWLSGAQPFLQGGVGATAVGPMGKVALGLRYSLMSNVSVSAGFEASLLAYQYKGSVFSSQRAGFVYSINVGL